MSHAMPRDLRYEPTAKWLRAELGGETIADTRRALVVWEPERTVPLYCAPREDVRMDLMRREQVSGDGAAARGEEWTIEAGGSVAERAAWSYADPDLGRYVAFRFDALDRWLEEDEEAVGHPRDPFHRIDIRRSSRHVAVHVDGHLLAESTRPTLLFETGLPVRYYLPVEDVRMELMTPSPTRTVCAYKGHASYFSAKLDGETFDDLAWTYSEPLRDSQEIRGLIAFFNEHSDITVDGEPAGRPKTQWSQDAREGRYRHDSSVGGPLRGARERRVRGATRPRARFGA